AEAIASIGLHQNANPDIRKAALRALSASHIMSRTEEGKLEAAAFMIARTDLAPDEEHYRDEAWLNVANIAIGYQESTRTAALSMISNSPDRVRTLVREALANGIASTLNVRTEQRKSLLEENRSVIAIMQGNFDDIRLPKDARELNKRYVESLRASGAGPKALTRDQAIDEVFRRKNLVGPPTEQIVRRLEAIHAIGGLGNVSEESRLRIIAARRDYARERPANEKAIPELDKTADLIIESALSKSKVPVGFLDSILSESNPAFVISSAEKILNIEGPQASALRVRAWEALRSYSNSKDPVIAKAARDHLVANFARTPQISDNEELKTSWNVLIELTKSTDDDTRKKACAQVCELASLRMSSPNLKVEERALIWQTLKVLVENKDSDVREEAAKVAFDLIDETLSDTSKSTQEDRQAAWQMLRMLRENKETAIAKQAKSEGLGYAMRILQAQKADDIVVANKDRTAAWAQVFNDFSLLDNDEKQHLRGLIEKSLPGDGVKLSNKQLLELYTITVAMNEAINNSTKSKDKDVALELCTEFLKLSDRFRDDTHIGKGSSVYRSVKEKQARLSQPEPLPVPTKLEELIPYREKRLETALQNEDIRQVNIEFHEIQNLRFQQGMRPDSVECAQMKLALARRLQGISGGFEKALDCFRSAAYIFKDSAPDSVELAECLRHCHQMDPSSSLWFSSRESLIDKALENCDKAGAKCGAKLYAECLTRASLGVHDPENRMRLNEQMLALASKQANEADRRVVCLEGLNLIQSSSHICDKTALLAVCQKYITLLPTNKEGLTPKQAIDLSYATVYAAGTLLKAGLDLSVVEPVFDRAITYSVGDDKTTANVYQHYAMQVHELALRTMEPTEKARLTQKAGQFAKLREEAYARARSR
ncbi:MAG: hypothetical protein K2X93_22085, partial [Candidatus Obscuribacterales bacterium]|nr:hypothetical protein [Candidatus Obscuribacterales bacterium]